MKIPGQVRGTQASQQKSSVPLWSDCSNSDKDPEQLVHFTRGGGLYNFLDIQKGIMNGMVDDTASLHAIYVTPDHRGDPDRFYAFDPSRCRAYLDVPCFQAGEIKSRHLKSTNRKSNEALIEVGNLKEIQNHRISVQEVDYFNQNHCIYENQTHKTLKEIYLTKADDAFWERLDMIKIIESSTPDNCLVVRKELLSKNKLNSEFEKYIHQLQQLCSGYKQHLKAYPNQEKQNILKKLESILNLDKTKPLIRELRCFSNEMNADSASLCKTSHSFSAFINDVLAIIIRLLSFNYLAPRYPLRFFKDSKGDSFVHEARDIHHRAENLFAKTNI